MIIYWYVGGLSNHVYKESNFLWKLCFYHSFVVNVMVTLYMASVAILTVSIHCVTVRLGPFCICLFTNIALLTSILKLMVLQQTNVSGFFTNIALFACILKCPFCTWGYLFVRLFDNDLFCFFATMEHDHINNSPLVFKLRWFRLNVHMYTWSKEINFYGEACIVLTYIE